MSKELPIPKDMMERFKDISQPHITQMDTLETALVMSSKLGNTKNYHYIKQLIGIEDSLKDNELFKSAAKLSEDIKKQFQPPNSLQDYIETQKKASLLLYEHNKPLIDAVNQFRQEALENILPYVQISEAFQQVNTILTESIEEASRRSEYHKTKADELQVKIAEVEQQAEIEEYKAEYKMHTEEAIKYMELVQPYEPMTVSKHGKQLEKELQPLIIRDTTRPKTGFTAHSTKRYQALEKKKEKMRKLYLKFRESATDYTEQECYNLISSKYFPEHTPDTVESYINETSKK